jgi:hypothetical protein
VTPPQVGTNPAPAPGGAVLRGGGLTVPSFSPYEVAFRIAPDAATITRFVFSTPWRCGGRRLAQTFFERGAGIAADGTFRLENPYEVRLSRTEVERGRVVVAGRFVEGGAMGTVQATSRTTRRGRTVARCDSGTRPWTAVP